MTELKRKTIGLIEVRPEFCLDTLYANEKYDTPFVIEDRWGGIGTVELCWFEGRDNNFQFIPVGGDRDTGIHPSDVAYIEVR